MHNILARHIFYYVRAPRAAGISPRRMPIENEIKLRIADVEPVRQQIAALAYTVVHQRTYENNVLFDTADRSLRQSRRLLRLRTAGGRTIVTFKGPGRKGPHKTREEIEFTASSADAVLALFEQLSFAPVFRYEKYRTEYAKDGAPGVITVDETPIGSFLELEGPPEWVDTTAHELRFSSADYIKDSYASLYVEHCREQGTEPSDMLFPR